MSFDILRWMKICVISNGFGEDQIACRLIQAWQCVHPEHTFFVFPLVGKGLEYQKINITPAFTNPTYPSGGFIRTVGDLWGDLKAGLLSNLVSQRRVIKAHVRDADVIFCVGDVFCLFMGGMKASAPVIFLPTAKSDSFMKHSAIEFWFMKRVAAQSYTRDEATCQSFRDQGLRTNYLGNPMMDLPLGSTDNLAFLNSDSIVGLFPGSREEAYENFRRITEVCQHLPGCEFVLAKAPSLDLDRLADSLGFRLEVSGKRKRIVKESFRCLVWETFEDVINQSSYCIGLAGTANEQAVYRGNLVFAFQGTGPQSSLLRFQEQRQLLGERLVLVESSHPASIARIIDDYPKNKTDWMASQASDAIIRDVLDFLGLA